MLPLLSHMGPDSPVIVDTVEGKVLRLIGSEWQVTSNLKHTIETRDWVPVLMEPSLVWRCIRI